MIEAPTSDTMIAARRSRFADGMMAAGSAALLVAGLAAVDTRVRDLITGFLQGDPLRSISVGIMRSQRLAHSVMDTVGYQSLGYEPLIAFALVGILFLVLMLKL
jgi:ABC-type uncharacterized transport system permease subunit